MGGVIDVREPTRTVAPAPPALAADAEPALFAQPLPDQLLSWVDSHRRLLFACLAVIYLLGFNGQWRLEPDSALYLTIGRSLAVGEGYTYHGQPHRLAYPGVPWLFGGLFKLFGAGSVLPHLVVMPLLGLGALALTYRLFLLHAGRPTAVLMTLLLGLTRTFYRYCFELMSDVPFLMGVMAFLAGFESIFYRRDPLPVGADGRQRARWFDWLLLVGGLAVAVMTRPTMWALLLAVVAAVAYWTFRRPIRWARIGLAAGLALAAAGVAAGFFYLDPRRADSADAPAYEADFLRAMTTDVDEVVTEVFSHTLLKMLQPSAAEAVFGIEIGEIPLSDLNPNLADLPLAAIPSLMVLALGLCLFRQRVLWGCFILFTLLMMLVRVVHVRYFLQILPLLLYGYWLGALWLRRRLGQPWGDRAFVALLACLVGVNVVRVAGFIVEQRQTPFLAHYKNGKLAAMGDVAEMVQSRTPEGAWVLAPRKYGRILTYLSGRYVAEPDVSTEFKPEYGQSVFVLEPMDETGLRWMNNKLIGVGEAVGPPVPGKGKIMWQLHRAIRIPPPEPISAPAAAPGGNASTWEPCCDTGVSPVQAASAWARRDVAQGSPAILPTRRVTTDASVAVGKQTP